jgi:protein-S-isoprenylcysteine O-methyltransferase Ste14
LSEQLLFRVIVAFTLILFVAHRGYYNRKFPPKDSETIDLLGKSKILIGASILSIVALVSTLLFVVAPNLMKWASVVFPPVLRWMGVGLALIGFALLEWSHRVLDSNWSDQPRIMETQEFVQSGPYRWIRHPMYTSFLLILGSTLFISANWGVGIAWIASISLDVVSRIRYEEGAMRERFGEEYELYQGRSGVLLPKL